jgi:hypothetical protein
MSYSRTYHAASDVVADVLRLRLWSILRPFIGADLSDFQSIFAYRQAVIVGSTVNWFLQRPEDWTPNNLNIVVPADNAHYLVDFFESIGYKSWAKFVLQPYKTTVKSFTLLTRDGRDRITVTETSSTSTFPPIISSFSTLGFNIMSLDGIVSLYPYATAKGIGIRNWPVDDYDEMDEFEWRGQRLVRYQVPWNGGCGYSCPKLRRRLWQLEGASVFNWRIKGSTFYPYDLKQIARVSHYVWRLSSKCNNPLCVHMFED